MKWLRDLDTSREIYAISIAYIPKLKDREPMWAWLDEADGGEYSLGGNTVYFYNEFDASHFALRWA
jgi:hypothetical protein